MTPKEAAKRIALRIREYADKEAVGENDRIAGLRNCANAFRNMRTKEQLKQLLSYMGTGKEEKNADITVRPPLWQEEKKITTLALPHGMGVPLTVDEQIDIFFLLDSEDLRVADFSRLIAFNVESILQKLKMRRKNRRCEKYTLV